MPTKYCENKQIKNSFELKPQGLVLPLPTEGTFDLFSSSQQHLLFKCCESIILTDNSTQNISVKKYFPHEPNPDHRKHSIVRQVKSIKISCSINKKELQRTDIRESVHC